MKCSLKDGLAWHLIIPGFTLIELLKKNYNLIEGAPEEWEVKAGSLSVRGEVITSDFLNEHVLGVFFYHKNQPEEKVEHLQRIYSYIQNNFQDLRLLNNPYKSKLFSSKIEFSRHVSQLPNAKTLLPEWEPLETEEDLDAAIDSFGFPFLIKPDSLSSGKGIIKIEDRATAIKVLRDSSNGIYHKNKLTKLRQLAKKLVSRETKLKTTNSPVKLLINEFIDTYHKDYKCYVNANIYYWMGDLLYADARVSHKGFNIHAGDSTNESLTSEQYSKIITQVFRLVKKDSSKIKEMVDSLDQYLIRVDCLINLESELIKVAEVNIKGGPGEFSRDKILPVMKEAGWDENKVQGYLDGKPCRIDRLFQ